MEWINKLIDETKKEKDYLSEKKKAFGKALTAQSSLVKTVSL